MENEHVKNATGQITLSASMFFLEEFQKLWWKYEFSNISQKRDRSRFSPKTNNASVIVEQKITDTRFGHKLDLMSRVKNMKHNLKALFTFRDVFLALSRLKTMYKVFS